MKRTKHHFKAVRTSTIHEEPELITIGDIRTVSAIYGYTSDTITKEALDGMGNTVTDKDIEKFLQQISKNNKKEEEE